MQQLWTAGSWLRRVWRAFTFQRSSLVDKTGRPEKNWKCFAHFSNSAPSLNPVKSKSSLREAFKTRAREDWMSRLKLDLWNATIQTSWKKSGGDRRDIRNCLIFLILQDRGSPYLSSAEGAVWGWDAESIFTPSCISKKEFSWCNLYNYRHSGNFT